MKAKTVKCGLLPGESRQVVERNHEPLRVYLENRLGLPVEMVVGKSYVATGEALRRGELDIAYLGPVTYILQSRLAALEPFARPTHGRSIGPTFRAAIIVPAFSTVENLRELRGREIALGDLVSTSGSWVPRYMLQQAGLVTERSYTRRHLGAHDAVAKAVASGMAAAGGISLPVLERLTSSGFIEPGSIRVLAQSAPIPEYMWTFRENLPVELKEAIREAFLTLAAAEPLATFNAASFLPAVDADVDRMRIWMEHILQGRLQPAIQDSSLAPPPVRRGTSAREAVHQ